MNQRRYRKINSSSHQNYLAHAGKKGMKWGYNDGQKNGNRTAEDEYQQMLEANKALIRIGNTPQRNRAKGNARYMTNKVTRDNVAKRYYRKAKNTVTSGAKKVYNSGKAATYKGKAMARTAFREGKEAAGKAVNSGKAAVLKGKVETRRAISKGKKTAAKAIDSGKAWASKQLNSSKTKRSYSKATSSANRAFNRGKKRFESWFLRL